MNTLEDYLEFSMGFRGSDPITLDKSDFNLMFSLAKQVGKGIGLTDRQHELAKSKLTYYADQFLERGYDVNTVLDNLRLPVREIDRSRWIKIVERYGADCLAVRFVFNKKLISAIEEIRRYNKDAEYDKKDKVHYFPLTEKNIFNIISVLKDKKFEIEESLKEKYNTLEAMAENKSKYIPGVYNFKLKNLHKKAVDFIISDVGQPTQDNLALLKDRQKLYGIHHFDEVELNQSIANFSTLSQKIIKRKTINVFVDQNTYKFDQLVESCLELERHPILVILNSNVDFDDLVVTHDALKYVFENEFSVLYRKENTDDNSKAFNRYIAAHKMNVPLDNEPKVVYINKDKFPKTLLKTDWKPQVAIYLGAKNSMPGSKLEHYLNQLDLVIHYGDLNSGYYKHELKLMDKL